jgi:hypothetical protein
MLLLQGRRAKTGAGGAAQGRPRTGSTRSEALPVLVVPKSE